PQQVSTESSQRVGIRHPGQPDVRGDDPAQIRVSKVDIAMSAWLLVIPAEAMPDVRWHQQWLSGCEQCLLVGHEGGAASKHPDNSKSLITRGGRPAPGG